jgi:hypothetical protein
MAKVQTYSIETSKHLEFQIFKKIYDGKTLVKRTPVSPEFLRESDLKGYAQKVGITLNGCELI